MKRDRTFRALLVISFGYWLLVVGAVIANVLLVPAFEQVGPLSQGCYQTDTLLIYVECVGFFGAKSIGFLLTLPWLILQMPWFVFNPIGLPFALLLWAPVVFPLVYWAVVHEQANKQLQPSPKSAALLALASVRLNCGVRAQVSIYRHLHWLSIEEAREAVADILTEVAQWPCQPALTCEWRDGVLRLPAENDADSTGMALLDAFWDAICAYINYSGEIHVSVESVLEV